MPSFLYRLWLRSLLGLLRFIRRCISVDGRLYAVTHARELQPFLASIGRMRAQAIFIKASKACPAYRDFLMQQDYSMRSKWNFAAVPVTTKENYVKQYTLEQRCYGGAIPLAGIVIDESSGSTGQPNNWVRSAAERRDVKRILQLNYQLIYKSSGAVLLNCFALGPWATGMNVSMSLVDVGIMKSIGPDHKKLENTLKLLGSKYRYLVFGYPPFIRSFVDQTDLDLSSYQLDFVVGGEGLSEGLRAHLLKSSNSVISSYGASDLEINIGVETQLTIQLRQLCLREGAISKEIFGRDTPPMIFQYNASDYVIEANEQGELLFTIGRPAAAAPKVRYNLRDSGGVYSFRRLAVLLERHNIDLSALTPRFSYFPFLFVYGRNDSSVPFYGAKIFPSDLEQVINNDPILAAGINSFQMRGVEDVNLISRLEIHLERCKGNSIVLPEKDRLFEILFSGLVRVNQDFREVTKMFDRNQITAIIHDYETGPFAGRDIRIKNKYIV